MLNGADDRTDIREDNYCIDQFSDKHKSASIYTENNCLLATFPQELQNAIGKRQVKYDSVFYDYSSQNLLTTNDKLWLFSSNELADTIDFPYYKHESEGSTYEKYKGIGNENWKDARTAYFAYDGAHGDDMRWPMSLRSLAGFGSDSILCVGRDGQITSDVASTSNGVSAGFTLKR